MKDAFLELVRSFWGMVLIAGFLLLAGGAASTLDVKSLKYVAENRWALYLGAAVCLIVSVTGYIWEKRTGDKIAPKPVAKDYGITIDYLHPGDPISNRNVRVQGSLTKALPPGYRLQMLRRWEANPDAYYPVRTAVIELDGKRWTADNCYIGGDPGDGRILEAALVGPDAALFFDTWKTCSDEFNRARQNDSYLFPAIQRFPSDVVPCARVNVRRS